MQSTTDGKGIDTLQDETNMADVGVAILVATQSWGNEPLAPMAKEGERRILWPIRGSEGDEFRVGSVGLW